jgi:hypothetical protein
MGVFDDTKLEQLDWMTQMTETIESDLNLVLAQFPDRYEIKAQDLIKGNAHSYMSFSVRNTLATIAYSLTRNTAQRRLSWEEDKLMTKYFKLEVEGEPILDLTNETMYGGRIFLVKTVSTFSDEDLQPIMGLGGITELRRLVRNSSSQEHTERANEILDILGNSKDSAKSKSFRKKIDGIEDRLRTIFKTNEWRIRDMALADKVGLWISGYITNGNLADLTNLTKLKVMTHNNMPIYSVKEEV